MSTMNEKQAYAAMNYFLEQIYLRTKSDDLGGFLSDMSLMADGSPADPAMLEDWREAVEYALGNPEPPYAQLI